MKSELAYIVPTLKACQKIPNGCFSKSALVWQRYYNKWWVNAREFDATPDEEIPAPTLKEILAEFLIHDLLPSLARGDSSWVCRCPVHSGSSQITVVCADKKPEDAALKTWFLFQKEAKRQDAEV